MRDSVELDMSGCHGSDRDTNLLELVQACLHEELAAALVVRVILIVLLKTSSSATGILPRAHKAYLDRVVELKPQVEIIKVHARAPVTTVHLAAKASFLAFFTPILLVALTIRKLHAAASGFATG